MTDNRENERGALWNKTSGRGMDFMTGTINGERVVAFWNKDKKNPNEPDLRILKSQDQPGYDKPRPDMAQSVDDDVIPF